MSTIEITDRGRGPQLSTSRITMLDLVPYFRQGCSTHEIIRWIPSLTMDEIAVAAAYYHARRDELDEADDGARRHRAEQVQAHAGQFSGETVDKRRAALRRQLGKFQREAASDGHSS
jgi:uncharacterized protein (DUF433 family)